MSATGMGTVDRITTASACSAFGHPFFNLGPLDMPMAKSEILMVRAPRSSPPSFGNATEVVGALHQDRFSGIMARLGSEAPSIPVHLSCVSLGLNNSSLKREPHFNVFVHQISGQPCLMMLGLLFNSLQQGNEYADEMTYRMQRRRGDMDGTPNIQSVHHACPRDFPPARDACWREWCGPTKFNRPCSLKSVTTAETKKQSDVPSTCLPGSPFSCHHRERVDALRPKWRRAARYPESVPAGRICGDVIENLFLVKDPRGHAESEHRILLCRRPTP